MKRRTEERKMKKEGQKRRDVKGGTEGEKREK